LIKRSASAPLTKTFQDNRTITNSSRAPGARKDSSVTRSSFRLAPAMKNTACRDALSGLPRPSTASVWLAASFAIKSGYHPYAISSPASARTGSRRVGRYFTSSEKDAECCTPTTSRSAPRGCRSYPRTQRRDREVRWSAALCVLSLS